MVENRLEAIHQSWQALTGAARAPHASQTYLVQLLVESPNALDSIDKQGAESLYQQVLRVLPK